jgi:Flp pilus assembly protein TadD
LSSFAHATAAKWHRKEGIYVLWGGGIAAAPGHPGRGKVDQVCATLLALLELPAAGYLAGPPLPGAPAPQTRRVDYRAHYKPSSLALAAASSGADEEALAKLRALGYVGASEAASAPEAARGSTRTAGSYNNQGLILKDKGRPEEAIQAFGKALELDPKLASALWNLSDVLFAGSRDPDRSDELLVRAFANGLPEGTRFLIGRAISYQRSGQPERSRKLMAAAAAARPDEPEVWLFSGRYRIETGNCQGALEDFHRAVGLAPRNPAAHASEGLARLCLGDRAGARACFRRSLELDPDQPKVRDYLRSL